MNVETAPLEAARAEFERLQQELASRRSTVHFAHTGVAMVAAIIFGGAAGKLGWDAHRSWMLVLSAASAVLSVSLITYAVARYIWGQRVLQKELSAFAVFQALRRRLGFEDPSVLLPQ